MPRNVPTENINWRIVVRDISESRDRKYGAEGHEYKYTLVSSHSARAGGGSSKVDNKSKAERDHETINYSMGY